jgi:hypothetical protein
MWSFRTDLSSSIDINVISQTSYSPKYVTPTHKESWLQEYIDIDGTKQISSEISHTRTDLTA